MKYPRWTKQETQTLRDCYATHSMIEIGRMIGKSGDAVRRKARLMDMPEVSEHAAANAGNGFNCARLSRRLGVSKHCIQRWAREGMPHTKVGGHGRLVFKWPQVKAWLVMQPIKTYGLSSEALGLLNIDSFATPVSPAEASLRLNINPGTLMLWRHRGCPTVKGPGNRTRCYILNDVIAWTVKSGEYGQRLSSRLVREWRERLEGVAA